MSISLRHFQRPARLTDWLAGRQTVAAACCLHLSSSRVCHQWHKIAAGIGKTKVSLYRLVSDSALSSLWLAANSSANTKMQLGLLEPVPAPRKTSGLSPIAFHENVGRLLRMAGFELSPWSGRVVAQFLLHQRRRRSVASLHPQHSLLQDKQPL